MGKLQESIVERHYRAFVDKNWDEAAAMMSPDVETQMPGSPPLKGIEPFIAYTQVFITAFPDARMTLDRCVEGANLVIAEGKFIGTHTGPLASPMGEIPPTGKHLELPFTDVFEVEDGKVTKHRVYFDNMTFMTQLGLMPEPASARG
ncbi:MAG: ester cyclase [Candidatus Dormibacteraeota bacterium]|uniref:Ester cyclase n=1 Tax=Candidatus Aeolococcus gillhamiae TaxID=3127015 RepID=A0A934MZ11_9BACT|nr:ester cyclase [Candidatus Dormibacteraeota bacterium]